MLLQFYIVLIVFALVSDAACLASGFEMIGWNEVDAVPLLFSLAYRLPVVARRYPLLLMPGRIYEAWVIVFLCQRMGGRLQFAMNAFAWPLQDDVFLAFDRLLGFDYVAFMHWYTGFPAVYGALTWVYGLLGEATLATFVVGLLARRSERIGERYLASLLITVMITCLIGGLVPATSAVTLLDPEMAKMATGATPLDQFFAVREGLIRVMPERMGGLITCPSLHVGLGLLIVYWTRRIWWARPVLGPAGVIFMLTAIPNGAHYILDCLAGGLVAWIAIVLTNALYAVRSPIVAVAITNAGAAEGAPGMRSGLAGR
jgi:hypothetical protein